MSPLAGDSDPLSLKDVFMSKCKLMKPSFLWSSIRRFYVLLAAVRPLPLMTVLLA